VTDHAPDKGSFSFEFDFDDNHCSSGVDAATEDLPELTAAPLRQLDDHQACERLRELAREAETDGNDELADDLNDAARQLDYCSSCQCALDEWRGSSEEYANDLLESVAGTVWSVSRERRRDRDGTDRRELTVSTLFDILGWRDGWSRIVMNYDGAQLTVRFHDGSGGSEQLSIVAATAEQIALADRWDDANRYGEDTTSRVLDADPLALKAALELWESTENPDETFGVFDDLYDEIAKADIDIREQLDDPDGPAREVLVQLASSWKGSRGDLLRAAVGISMPANLACSYAA
jgi:hypothetical protein